MLTTHTQNSDYSPAEIACPGNAVENSGNPVQTGVFDYVPFGMQMPDRSYVATGSGYRFGFNNMEKDDELKGPGNSYDFGARIYDPRVGRFLSVDPWWKHYTSWSPYVGFNNNPIIFNDPTGKGGEITITRNSQNQYVGHITFNVMLYSDKDVDLNDVKAQIDNVELRPGSAYVIINDVKTLIPVTVSINVTIEPDYERAVGIINANESQANNFMYIAEANQIVEGNRGNAAGNSIFVQYTTDVEVYIEEILHTADPRYDENNTIGSHATDSPKWVDNETQSGVTGSVTQNRRGASSFDYKRFNARDQKGVDIHTQNARRNSLISFDTMRIDPDKTPTGAFGTGVSKIIYGSMGKSEPDPKDVKEY